jgi:LemA protein
MKIAIGCLLILALLGGLLVLWGTGVYNGLVGAEEGVTTAWAQVETVYQRRADLIPNLVATVKGAADFEQDTLTQVIEARSKATQVGIEATPDLLNNPEAFARFQQAQDGLSSALSRLLVVVERYPELKAVAAFQDLMVQLEGTENRISVERNRYNEVARGYNTRIRQVPTAWFIRLLGWPFEAKNYFASQPGAEEAPTVDFASAPAVEASGD